MFKDLRISFRIQQVDLSQTVQVKGRSSLIKIQAEEQWVEVQILQTVLILCKACQLMEGQCNLTKLTEDSAFQIQTQAAANQTGIM